MADQKRNQQSDQGNQDNQGSRDDESVGVGGSQRERSNREPVSTANDRGLGSERRDVSSTDSELEEEGIESDLDSETDVEDEDIEGGSNR